MTLPRHISGHTNPLRKWTPRHIRAPLVISIREQVEFEIDDETKAHNTEHSSDDLEHEPQVMTAGEWLDRCQYDEEEEDDSPVPRSFEAHFIADEFGSSRTPPAECDIPLLFMTEHDALPVLMSSMLYQRRVWHIDEPLAAIGFSQESTIIELYLGWLEDQVSSTNSLVSKYSRILFPSH